ncbi:Protein CBG09292 [Caenorhabditis briggsae]|uniref:Uncharacterized protein n=2 Tax=Caenorhabditis briggsae TaxID=6238 RepID=A0AAE9D2K2_CAEBR|nr:Protein CBG09292 [Caenorhabditis briggsae]ULT90096.1 hypothetical protein L3Y34_008462 [Caenorhabditis briggsae]CAP29269.1 Protein CBG09292 [Caenorhabditis briggsae]
MSRSCLLLLAIMVSVLVEAQGNWLMQRNLQQYQNMGTINDEQIRNIKKTFLPPRYQNLWGRGESSKVVGHSALAPQNMDDYKMRTQQRQVFSWQPSNTFNEW